MKSALLFLSALLLILSAEDIKCQDDSHYFYSPFDLWRKSFTPSTSSSFWPNIHNYEPDFRDSELDSFSGEERTEGGSLEKDHETFDVDVISSDSPVVHDTNPNFYFHHTIPFFNNNPFFSNFGSFGFRQREPWWKGANVCTERQEDEEEESDADDEETRSASEADSIQKSFTFIGATGLQFSVNSCIEKPHKHVCKQVLSVNGKKRTLTVTHQCCHGFGRPRNAEIATPCAQMELKSIDETAEDMGAKEFMRSVKNNGLESKFLSNVTVFMPTDRAFTDFSEQMFENNLVVLPLQRKRRSVIDTSGITTKELALSHMVDGWVNIEDVRNEQTLTTQFQNSTIRINLFPRPPNSQNYEYPFRYTANCAPILKINKMATNGIVHVIDKVIPPVSKSLMDIIRERSDLVVLRTILESTKLSELLEGNKPYTIFAPTDSAFAKLDQHLRKILKEGKGCAANILKNHILDLTFCSVAVVSDAKTTAYNLLGESVNLERTTADDKQTTEINDLIGAQDIVINGAAKILETDIMGTNGVLHTIDTILPTETALPITSLMETKNLTIFKKLIEASNMQDDFDEMNNVTYFVPTDKAFEGNYWKQKLEESPDDLKNNAQLRDFLNYHIVDPMTKTCHLAEKMMHTKAGVDLRVNLYSTHALFTNVMNRATVNCARLVHFDDESCGSVLHQVDKVLSPPNHTLLDELEINSDYSMFLNLIKIANLTHLLEDTTESFTLLIPKNDVFLEVGEWFEELTKKPEEVESLVKTHIINDVVCCAGIIPTNWPFVRTIDTVNNKQLRISRDRRPKIENAGITKCDIVANNGILHEINDVLSVKKRYNTERNHHVQNFDEIFF